MPRDREGQFEPQLVGKHQRRLPGFDEKVIYLYGQGTSQRDIQAQLEEIYGIEVSQELISSVTDAVLEDVKAWRNRPLDTVYPIVYLDALVTKDRLPSDPGAELYRPCRAQLAEICELERAQGSRR